MFARHERSFTYHNRHHCCCSIEKPCKTLLTPETVMYRCVACVTSTSRADDREVCTVTRRQSFVTGVFSQSFSSRQQPAELHSNGFTLLYNVPNDDVPKTNLGHFVPKITRAYGAERRKKPLFSRYRSIIDY